MLPFWPTNEAMLTIRPQPASRIGSTHAWASITAPSRLTSHTSSYCVRVSLRSSASRVMPELLTRQSIRPKRSRALRTMTCGVPSSPTLARTSSTS